jgi:hypothetical protein
VIYRVRNNDSASARVGHNVTTATPDFVVTNLITLSSNQWSSNIEVGGYFTSPPNIVAQSRDLVNEETKDPSNVVLWNEW